MCGSQVLLPTLSLQCAKCTLSPPGGPRPTSPCLSGAPAPCWWASSTQPVARLAHVAPSAHLGSTCHTTLPRVTPTKSACPPRGALQHQAPHGHSKLACWEWQLCPAPTMEGLTIGCPRTPNKQGGMPCWADLLMPIIATKLLQSQLNELDVCYTTGKSVQRSPFSRQTRSFFRRAIGAIHSSVSACVQSV